MSYALTVTVTDTISGQVLADVRVNVCSDADGATPLFSEYTTTAGVATFSLDDGTYYVHLRKVGYSFTNPTTVVIDGAADEEDLEGEFIAGSSVGNTDLSNLALAILGGAVKSDYPWIDDYDADSGDANASPSLKWCQILLPHARAHVQARHLWRALGHYAAPGAALDEANALTVPGYQYLFSRPADCVVFAGVFADTVNTETGELTPLPYLEVGAQIACNYDEDILFAYTVAVLDPVRWGEPLFQATAHYLAYLLCRPAGTTAEVQSYLFKLWEAALDGAIADDAAGRFIYRPPDRLRRDRLPAVSIQNGQLYIRRF